MGDSLTKHAELELLLNPAKDFMNSHGISFFLVTDYEHGTIGVWDNCGDAPESSVALSAAKSIGKWIGSRPEGFRLVQKAPVSP